MKILWISNQLMANFSEKLNLSMGFGGGWMELLAKQLCENNELAVVAPISRRGELIEDRIIDQVHCFTIPTYKVALKPNEKVRNQIIKIIKNFQPDIIHIWGTEYVHTYSAMLAAKDMDMVDRTIISIQGMVSVYARHYMAYISSSKFPFSVGEFAKRRTIKQQQKAFIKRGEYERKALEISNNVIGRTEWDEACTKQINPDICYFFCNETLRSIFYNYEWDITKCNKYSIFVSQSNYPIKGFHLVLEAIAILKRKWPNVTVYTTGHLTEGINEGSYSKLIRNYIKKFHLEKNVVYLGKLNEEQMCEQYLKSHVFVSSSSIENSPNSVGEAMLLGMPIVSSDVGGVKNILKDKKEGYIYPADEIYMLAYYIDKIFTNKDEAVLMGKAARNHALKTHNREQNFLRLLEIYNELINKTK